MAGPLDRRAAACLNDGRVLPCVLKRQTGSRLRRFSLLIFDVIERA
jgi:hypothetical protein